MTSQELVVILVVTVVVVIAEAGIELAVVVDMLAALVVSLPNTTNSIVRIVMKGKGEEERKREIQRGALHVYRSGGASLREQRMEAIEGPCVTTHPEASAHCPCRSYELTYFL